MRPAPATSSSGTSATPARRPDSAADPSTDSRLPRTPSERRDDRCSAGMCAPMEGLKETARRTAIYFGLSRAPADERSHEDDALGFWWVARLVFVLVLADVVAQAIGLTIPGDSVSDVFAWLGVVAVVAILTAMAMRLAHGWISRRRR